MKYPSVGGPTKGRDGLWRVTIIRGAGDKQVIPFPDEQSAKTAADTLRRAAGVLLPAAPKRIRYYGPYHEKHSGLYRIRWTDEAGSHSRNFSGPEAKAEADQWLAEHRAAGKSSAPQPGAKEIAEGEQGSPLWWRSKLSAAGAEVLESEADALQKGRVFASLAAAAAKHSADAELDKRLAELEVKEKERRAMRKHGPRSQRQRVPTAEPPVPGQPFK